MKTWLQDWRPRIILISGLAALLPTTAFAQPAFQRTWVCGGYNITVTEQPAGVFSYRSRSRNGNLNLSGGTRQRTEGVQVFKFSSGNYAYWVWDGTLDNPRAGNLEVYQNNRILMQRSCRR